MVGEKDAFYMTKGRKKGDDRPRSSSRRPEDEYLHGPTLKELVLTDFPPVQSGGQVPCGSRFQASPSQTGYEKEREQDRGQHGYARFKSGHAVIINHVGRRIRQGSAYAWILVAEGYLESRSSSTSNPSCLTARLKSCGLVEAATATL